MYRGITTWREYLSLRRVAVTLGVAGTMGAVEWIGLGHPLGLVFGLLMGVLALVAAPAPWLYLLPWGLRRPPLETALRALGVLALSALCVLAAYLAFFALRDRLVPVLRPLATQTLPHLSAWSSVVISIPLFAAAGWGLSRHLELERRLEVHDQRELALVSALEEARLLALQSRLDPHFLFNALNLVAELCRDEPEEAERCVLRLSGLLRAALDVGRAPDSASGVVPLGRELELCADYLELARARFGERMRVELRRADGTEAARVPLFAVQALCENAVRHGVERSAHGGTVHIEVEPCAGGAVRVRVTSPGAFDGERPGGIGLELTRRRLALAFGAQAGARLELRAGSDGCSTVAELTLPAPEASAS
jgi:signal transduction histidine kinase